MLQGKEKEAAVKSMIDAAVKDFNITRDQAAKRVDALLKAVDNGLFDGIPKTGPADFVQQMFVQVKTRQIMETQID